MNAMQATLDAGAADAAWALTQIDNLNSEPPAAMAERFKLVATVHGEKRRHNQKRHFWEDKIKGVEAKTSVANRPERDCSRLTWPVLIGWLTKDPSSVRHQG